MESLAEELEPLEPAAAAVGLKRNSTKCKLWSPGPGSLPLPRLPSVPKRVSFGVRLLRIPDGRAAFV